MCLLCGDKENQNLGPFLTRLESHLLCVKFCSGILNTSSPPKDTEFVKEVRRVQTLTCVYCKKPGAFVGCGIKVKIVSKGL